MITMNKEEWILEGTRRFGIDYLKWQFVCPGCGHIQTPEDFRQYKDRGASPESAYKECIGRYSGGKSWMFTDPKKLRGGPCDYASYGLLNIAPVMVIDGDKKISSFKFGGK